MKVFGAPFISSLCSAPVIDGTPKLLQLVDNRRVRFSRQNGF